MKRGKKLIFYPFEDKCSPFVWCSPHDKASLFFLIFPFNIAWHCKLQKLLDSQYSLFNPSRGSFPGVHWRVNKDLCHGLTMALFNCYLQSWMALFKIQARYAIHWLQLKPVASHSFLYINSAVIYWAHIVNTACSSVCSKEFSRTCKELLSLLSLHFW